MPIFSPLCIPLTHPDVFFTCLYLPPFTPHACPHASLLLPYALLHTPHTPLCALMQPSHASICTLKCPCTPLCTPMPPVHPYMLPYLPLLTPYTPLCTHICATTCSLCVLVNMVPSAPLHAFVYSLCVPCAPVCTYFKISDQFRLSPHSQSDY